MGSVIIKFAKGGSSRFCKMDYSNPDAVNKLIHYVYKHALSQMRKGRRLYGSIGTMQHDPSSVIRSFQLIKKIYHKETGVQAKHIIISIGPDPNIKTNKLKKIVEKVVRYFARDYMIFYGVHCVEPENFHLHVILNSVSKEGKKINITTKEWYKFKKHVNQVLDRHNLD